MQRRWDQLLAEADELCDGRLLKAFSTCGDGFCHQWSALGAVDCLDGKGKGTISQRDYSFRMARMMQRLDELALKKGLADHYKKNIEELLAPLSLKNRGVGD